MKGLERQYDEESIKKLVQVEEWLGHDAAEDLRELYEHMRREERAARDLAQHIVDVIESYRDYDAYPEGGERVSREIALRAIEIAGTVWETSPEGTGFA